MNKTC